VQYWDGVLNAAYPFEQEPELAVSELAGFVESWTAKKFVSIQLASRDARQIARWIDRYFEKTLSAGTEYAVTVRLERIKQ